MDLILTCAGQNRKRMKVLLAFANQVHVIIIHEDDLDFPLALVPDTPQPTRSPINFWSLEKCAPIGGQIVVQVVKMKLIVTTLFLTRSL
jgi:hypothetical protein